MLQGRWSTVVMVLRYRWYYCMILTLGFTDSMLLISTQGRSPRYDPVVEFIQEDIKASGVRELSRVIHRRH